MLPLLFSYYPIGYIRTRSILKQIDRFHLQYGREPHFHLDNLGVLAAVRGQGLSSKFIRPFLEEADKQGRIAYTNTVNRTNVPFYEHFGFECVEECPIQGTGVTVFALRRDKTK